VFAGFLLRQAVVGLGLNPGKTGVESPNDHETTRQKIVDEGEKEITMNPMG
jgi:hypothetical protein